MSTGRLVAASASAAEWSPPAGASLLVQRRCSCGGSAGLDDRCEECRRKEITGQRTPLRPKLRIGPVDDPYERQADRVAEAVMRMPAGGSPPSLDERITPLVQRQEETEEEEEIQAARLADGRPLSLQRQTEPEDEEEAPLQTARLQRQVEEEEREEEEPAVQAKRTAGGGGRGRAPLAGTDDRGGGELPASTRAFFERRFGFDFSRVRIHTGPEAADSARRVRARAYTVGHNVVFGAGQYAPQTAGGRRLLAHELTHVVQQTGGGRRRLQRWMYDAKEKCLAAGVRRAKRMLRGNWKKASRAYKRFGCKLMDFIGDGKGPKAIFKYQGSACGYSWKSVDGSDLITIPKGVKRCCWKCGKKRENVKKLLGYTLIHETAHWCASSHKREPKVEHGDAVEKAIFGGSHVMENCELKKVSSYGGKPCFSCPGVNDK